MTTLTKEEIHEAALYCISNPEVQNCTKCRFYVVGFACCDLIFAQAYRAKCADVEELRKALEEARELVRKIRRGPYVKLCKSLALIFDKALEDKE